MKSHVVFPGAFYIALLLVPSDSFAQSALACISQQRSCQSSCMDNTSCVRACYNEAQQCIATNGTSAPNSSTPFSDDYRESSRGNAATRNRSSSPRITPNTTPYAAYGMRPGEYPPITDCLTWTNINGDFGLVSRITNFCGEPLEANWVDVKGGMNMITVGANGRYEGGAPVQRLWACRKNDGVRLIDSTTAACRQ